MSIRQLFENPIDYELADMDIEQEAEQFNLDISLAERVQQNIDNGLISYDVAYQKLTDEGHFRVALMLNEAQPTQVLTLPEPMELQKAA